MHLFNRQKNIIREIISKLRNHLDDAIEPLQPLQVKLVKLTQPIHGIQTNIFIHYEHTPDTDIV